MEKQFPSGTASSHTNLESNEEDEEGTLALPPREENEVSSDITVFVVKAGDRPTQVITEMGSSQEYCDFTFLSIIPRTKTPAGTHAHTRFRPLAHRYIQQKYYTFTLFTSAAPDLQNVAFPDTVSQGPTAVCQTGLRSIAVQEIIPMHTLRGNFPLFPPVAFIDVGIIRQLA